MSDNINHPSHYTQGGIECIDAIKASMTYHEYAGYLKGNCIKYLWRYRNKGRAVEDLKKAQWYLDKLISENESNMIKQDGSVMRVVTDNHSDTLNDQFYGWGCRNESIDVIKQDGTVTTHEIYYNPNE